MSKVMLVEDDANLLEIYQARLAAEGFQIVTAKDGEEALAIAVKERPDLIIADIMMPKVSGFDMLDILRSTPETKNVKIIMMTALSQLEDKQRAEKLGANRYLVKSQVTLEDVVRVTKEVLADQNPTNISGIPVEPAQPQIQNPASVSTSLTEGVQSTPVAPLPQPSIPEPSPASMPSQPAEQQPVPTPPATNPQTLPVDASEANQAPTQEAPAQTIPVINEKREHKVIEPSPNFTTDKPSIDNLLAQESVKPATVAAPALNSVIQPSTGTTMEPVLNNPAAAPAQHPAVNQPPTPPAGTQLIQ